MSLLKQRFEKAKEKHLDNSSYIHFVKAVKGRGYSRITIQKWFNKLVDKDDYALSEKRDIINFIMTL